jgi:hypothetical protein
LALAACERESADEDTAVDTAEEIVIDVVEADAIDAQATPVEELIRSGDPADDDVEYLYRLGLMRGHLAAFIELYRAGSYDMALTHVKHPESELYADVVPAFAARGKVGFADELTKLAGAADARGDVEPVYEQAISAIRDNAPAGDVKTTLLAVSVMVNTAAEEFEIGVDDAGAVVEPHEYQDAYGFLVAAREMLAEEETGDINAGEAIAIAHEQIDLSLASFDGLVVDETAGIAATLYGASEQIESVALRL